MDCLLDSYTQSDPIWHDLAQQKFAPQIAPPYLRSTKTCRYMGTIRFELRKEKKDKSDLIPIRLIYSLAGQRKYFNTKQKLLEENWDDKEQHAVYTSNGKMTAREINEINEELEKIKKRVRKTEDRFFLNEIVYTSSMVVNSLKDKPIFKKESSSKELFRFIDNYINDHEHKLVKGSLSVYKSLKAHLENFEKSRKTKVNFDNVDYVFFTKFEKYLTSLTKIEEGKLVPRLNNITIAKQLSTLKTFLNYAKVQGIDIPKNYSSFKINRDTDLEVIALTEAELHTLYSLDLRKNPSWERVRDVFIFSCYTGLRYSDLKQLRREHIKDQVIDLRAVKTSLKTLIPLNKYSKAILKKYASWPTPLPVISNQKSNEHLAKVCDWAGISEPIEIVRKQGGNRISRVYPKHELIRMHCGRKTFATIHLKMGMSAEYVMKIGGWKDYKSFKRYINITDDTIITAMHNVWKKGMVSKTKIR